MKAIVLLRLIGPICLIGLMVGLINFLISSTVFAARGPGSGSVSVKASVGEFHLTISGYASPFASVTLYANGQLLSGTVADANGVFSFVGIPISRGNSSFCLTTIDVKRLGDSEACITTEPAASDISKTDLFLPPTLGLFRTQIGPGEEALVFGYSMPGSLVTLHFSNGKDLQITADSSGYYEFRIKNLEAATYKLSATALYQRKDSLLPTKTKELTVLTLQQKAVNRLEQLFTFPKNVLPTLSPLLVILLLIILLIILLLLLKKLFPNSFTSIGQKLQAIIPVHQHQRRKKLHHWWFVGY